MVDRDYFKIAVVIYGLAAAYTFFLWRRGFREDNRVTYLLLGGSFVFHTIAMGLRGFSFQRCPVTNIYEAMTFISWTMVATYLLVGAFNRLRFLGAFAAPLLFGIGVFSLMPALDQHGPKPEFTGGWISLHATLILLSYGAFGLSGVAGAMFLTQEHDLKFRKLRAVVSRLPSIERLERVTNRSLFSGFILLTFGLALVPILFRDRPPTTSVLADPKLAWSLFVWALYLTLLVVRWRFTVGGRAIAWGAIASFCFVMLTFWGVTLLSPAHN